MENTPTLTLQPAERMERRAHTHEGVGVVDAFAPSCRSHFMATPEIKFCLQGGREMEKREERVRWGGAIDRRPPRSAAELYHNHRASQQEALRSLLRRRTEECWLFTPHLSLIFISLSTSGTAFPFFSF